MDTPAGLIGLGNMGAALAQRLLETMPVVGFDPGTQRQAVARSLGVEVVPAAASVAESVDVVILSLPTPAISAGVVADVLVPSARRPLTVLETSTVLPSQARDAQQQCAAGGVGYVCAAILSGVASVVAGTTTLLVGGDATSVAGVHQVLDSITSSRRLFSEPGAAMAAKVINNAVAHDVFVVLSEAAALADANGITLSALVDLLGDPEGGLIRPLVHRVGERVANSDYSGGMSVTSARKDSQLALQMAQADGVPLFVTQAAHTVFEIGLANGLGDLDYAAVATLWHRWTGRGLDDRQR
jgi:3-hydroxyisobutyrate dehydrogenase-like beta-hydroxyacid dehydrogenase